MVDVVDVARADDAGAAVGVAAVAVCGCIIVGVAAADVLLSVCPSVDRRFEVGSCSIPEVAGVAPCRSQGFGGDAI